MTFTLASLVIVKFGCNISTVASSLFSFSLIVTVAVLVIVKSVLSKSSLTLT